jgi:carbon-monoxide dehydrogenase catalytic subunit
MRLAKAIRIGMVRGVVSLAGQSGPLLPLARELIRQDMFVVATKHIEELAGAGLLDVGGRDEAGVGLAEFCTLCDIPPVWNMADEDDEAPLRSFCARLARALDVAVTALPVVGMAGEKLELLADPGQSCPADPAALAEAIGRVVTVKRLSLGFNDRFDGSVYS